MPPMTPKTLSPDAIRLIGSHLADYAGRCSAWAAALDKVNAQEISVKAYAAWPRGVKELSRFFSSLEGSVLTELERRGAYHSDTPE